VGIDSFSAAKGEKLACIHKRLLKMRGQAVGDVTTA
jgi:hypothetical protein